MRFEHPRRGNIVVIDDTPANLRLLARMLMDSGYKVRPMPSGELGLESIRASLPDLILLDINMPGIDGYEVCRILKADPLTVSVPVIFISALGDALDKVTAFEVGGVDYITKPFKVEEVQARIRTQLDLKFSRDAMEQMNRDLQRSLEEKYEFVNVLVHELKNPLNVMMGYSDILVEDAGVIKGDEVANIGGRMADTSRKMHELVTKILEVNQLELGEERLIIKELDLDAVICGVIANYRRIALEKGIQLDYERNPETTSVLGDEGAVFSIVENLVSNALKFSSRGGKVSVGTRQEEGRVICWVSDRGPGFLEEDKPRLFSKYARLSARPTAGESSTGLGLSIVKGLLDALSGTIELESQPGHGACFSFTLPLPRVLEKP